ncbi:hypothetical protein EYC84_008346 [Monilinia fructicola]|uniref:Uncharacterized protein n=1 Tax=Monilinia fructicola TaxID=38448 RepID=A0A5M9JGW4_MONFR|nr:hypothetical protein EYC84_008346 [Monilinia fructicola]
MLHAPCSMLHANMLYLPKSIHYSTTQLPTINQPRTQAFPFPFPSPPHTLARRISYQTKHRSQTKSR